MKLANIAKNHGTDRVGKHSYTKEYEKLFGHRREEVKKVVELGTAEGAGLKMWHDYFPNAEILGADIQPERVAESLIKEYPRVDVFECDQRFESDCERLIGRQAGVNIDLFIDDGSHVPEDQVFTAKTIMPMLWDKAIYVIEDVADKSIFEEFRMFEAEMIEYNSGRYDDVLIILRHKYE